MRLIDADAIISQCEEYSNLLKNDGTTDREWAVVKRIILIIKEQPTIEPQRKKGKWINIRHDNIAECDQCGITGRAWMNFCFDCGADMREDAEEPKKCDTCQHEKERWFSRCADCSDYELWESKE